jgi:radical SAM protein with 4Fe4S-binding SPASM domain
MSVGNRLNFISSYLRRETRMSHFPPSLEIEVTNRCNEDCVMCPRHLLARPFGNLEMSLLDKILGEVSGRVELINLFHFGEPMLHPRLGELIRRCKESGAKVLVTTNGTLLNERRAHELIDSGLDMLVVSLDAASKEVYSAVRRLGNFEKVLSNVESFLLLKRRSGRGPHTQAQMVALRFNREEIDKFVTRWRGKADSVRVKRFYNTANIGAEIGEATPDAKRKTRPCLLLWREPVVLYDGTVVPCCVDMIGEKPIGNVNERPLMEIWNDAELVEMRRLHAEGRRGEIGLCRNCHVFEYGAPAVVGSLFFNDITLRKIGAAVENFHFGQGLRAVDPKGLL